MAASLPLSAPRTLPRWSAPVVTAVWSVLLTVLLVVPFATASPTLGEEWTRNTVRLSMAYYAAAALLMLGLERRAWESDTPAVRLARLLWTLAWLAYVIHLACAFHFYHGWSHAEAVEHVRRRARVGEGIFVSHLFTLLWTLDVAWWWLARHSYAGRAAWVGWVLHGFMSFIVFNGTVVYETGPVQWGGAVYFVIAAVLLVRRVIAASGRTATQAASPAESRMPA
jgi:hypothetical protein